MRDHLDAGHHARVAAKRPQVSDASVRRRRRRRFRRRRRRGDAARGRLHGRHRLRARRARRRRLAGQHVSRRGLRHPVAPVRVLLRPEPRLVAALRAAGRDPGLPGGGRGALGRQDPDRNRGDGRPLRGRALGARDERGPPRGRRAAHRLRPALDAERAAAAGPGELRRPGLPHRALAPRRAAGRPPRRGDRDRLQRDPGRARDPAARRARGRLPALARAGRSRSRTSPTPRSPAACSPASRRCSAPTAGPTTPSTTSARSR